MLTARKNVYLTPEGKATFDSDGGKNTIVALQHTMIDDHTAKELNIQELFDDDAKERASEVEKSSSMLERAKARQKASDKTATAKTAHKTEPVKADGGSK